MEKRRVINFLGIGAHAAGSNWLWQSLSRHPDVGFLKPDAHHGVPRKETHYWNRFSDHPIDWYLDQFDWDHRVVGEITPAYARLDRTVIKQIGEAFPQVQVFYLIRDPLARTWSDVRKRLQKASFWHGSGRMKYIIEQASRPKVAIRNDYVGTVERWRHVFGSDQVHVFLCSDIDERPREILTRASEILDIDPAVYERIADAELHSGVDMGLDKTCPPEFIEWFRHQNVMSWEEQIRHIENMGVLESALPRSEVAI